MALAGARGGPALTWLVLAVVLVLVPATQAQEVDPWAQVDEILGNVVPPTFPATPRNKYAQGSVSHLVAGLRIS